MSSGCQRVLAAKCSVGLYTQRSRWRGGIIYIDVLSWFMHAARECWGLQLGVQIALQ